MKMVEIGYNHRHGRSFCIDRPNGTESWLMLIVKTPAHFRINGKDIRTGAHSFIIFRPDTPQYYYPASTEYFDDWMHFFPDENEQKMMEELNIPLDRPVDITDITEMSEMIRSMCFEHYSTNTFKEKAIDLYYQLLMYTAIREALTNAVRHGGATALKTQISRDKNTCIIKISNNGRPPEKNISEGGGLGNLRKTLEREGAGLSYSFEDGFALVISLPQEYNEEEELI